MSLSAAGKYCPKEASTLPQKLHMELVFPTNGSLFLKECRWALLKSGGERNTVGDLVSVRWGVLC